MKNIGWISSSVRAACQHTSACFPSNRGFMSRSPLVRCANVEFISRTVVAQQPCLTGVRPFHGTNVNTALVQQVSAAPLPASVPLPGKKEDELAVQQFGRRARAAPHLSPYVPYTKPQSKAASPVNFQSLFEGEVIPELCSRLADFPSNDRAEGLATLLGACVDFGLDAHSPLVCRLINECMELLPSRDVGLSQLCHLGEVGHELVSICPCQR